MSKMRMPEMSIVRFTESDVIVASLFTVEYTGDTTGYNFTITRPDGVQIYNNSRGSSGRNMMGGYGGMEAKFYYSETTNSYSLRGLIENDSRDPATPVPVDGLYTYSNGVFTRSGFEQ